jgi:hypothetical protein
MKTTGACELRGSAASMVALLPVNAAKRASAAPMLLLAPFLTMLIPSAARLAACDRGLRAKPGVGCNTLANAILADNYSVRIQSHV